MMSGKRLLEQPHFELAAKGVFRLGRCCILRQGVPGLWVSNREARLPTVGRLTGGTERRLVPVERSDRLPGRLRTGTSGPRYGGALPWRTVTRTAASGHSSLISLSVSHYQNSAQCCFEAVLSDVYRPLGLTVFFVCTFYLCRISLFFCGFFLCWYILN